MLTVKGSGLVNSAIDHLPFELHLPGYKFLGPGTKLQKRLARGDHPINRLDASAKEHDIAYAKHKDLEERHKADKVLENKAWSLVKDKDSSFGEKASAWLVTNIMKAKRKLGMGIRKKRSKKISFKQSLLIPLKKSLDRGHNDDDLKTLSKNGLIAARQLTRTAGGRKKITLPRVLPLPSSEKKGGFLPLIPLFAGLSALGGLAGGASGIASAVLKAKAAKKKLEEAERHNKTMEAIALGKKGGEGLFLKKYRTGLGLYLRHQHPKNL